MKIVRSFIDWESTGNKLYRLRSDNPHLRKFVCSAIKKDTEKCDGDGNCEICTDRHMDRSISRPELAAVFGVSDSVINNWETGRTQIGIEDLLFYCRIAQVGLEDIIVFQDAKT